jgi:hypothetical protein
MPDIVQVLLDHKEVLGVATSAVGVVKTAYDMIQSRSRASTRDKWLMRIQALVATRQALNIESAADSHHSTDLGDLVESQLSEALSGFAKASQEVREKQAVRGELGLFQRAFVLYKPASTRAWVPHMICWLIALFVPFFFLGTSLPDGGDEPSWAAFVQSWKDPDIYFGFLFFVGVFLLARLWAVSERKINLKKQGTIALPPASFRLATVAALVYGVCGVAFLVGAGVVGLGDVAAGVRFGVFGVIIAGCAVTVEVWGKLRDRKISLTTKGAIFLLLPAILLALVIMFDVDGIVLNEFRHDVFGYWRSWIHEPAGPLLAIPVVALPVYAGFCCLRSARSELRGEG